MAKTVGKDSGGESRACIDRKTTIYRLEACEIAFFENTALAVHSSTLLYFADLPVSSSLYSIFIVHAAQLGFIIQYDTVQAPCSTLVQ